MSNKFPRATILLFFIVIVIFLIQIFPRSYVHILHIHIMSIQFILKQRKHIRINCTNHFQYINLYIVSHVCKNLISVPSIPNWYSSINICDFNRDCITVRMSISK